MAGYTIQPSQQEKNFDIHPQENDGVGNESIPHSIVSVQNDNIGCKFIIKADLSYRFIPGFTFNVIDSDLSGKYTVKHPGAITDTSTGQPLTIIPVVQTVPDITIHKFGVITYECPTVSTSLQLTGSGVATYNSTTTWGNALLNNIVRITENFANDTPPPAPLEGQLWYNTKTRTLMIFQGKTHNLEGVNLSNNSWLFSYYTATHHKIKTSFVVYGDTGVSLQPRVFTTKTISSNGTSMEVSVVEKIPDSANGNGKIYFMEDWIPISLEQPTSNVLPDLSCFADKQYVDIQLISFLEKLNEKRQEEKTSIIKEIQSKIVNRMPYDITMYAMGGDKQEILAASTLMARDILLEDHSTHTARTMAFADTEVEIQLDILTSSEPHTFGKVTFNPYSFFGSVKISNTQIKQGDIIVATFIKTNPNIKNIFITLVGSTPLV